jgi:hypothetical protein
MTLFRPVGLRELELIAESGWRAFPPRLPEQPIFYPVLTHEYARKICTEWNAREADSGHAGFVTRFEINNDTARRYPIQNAGGRAYQELWVPAEELDAFNRSIIGVISVVEAIYGPTFAGDINAVTNLPTHIALRLRT